MELKDFVKTALMNVIQAVDEVQRETLSDKKLEGFKIRPQKPNETTISNTQGVEEVEFDVAVTISDEKNSTASGGIFVASFGIGGKANKKTGNETISRIKFSISIRFRLHEDLKNTLTYNAS